MSDKSSLVPALRSRARALAGGLIDLAFPPRCAACGSWGEGAPLCEHCAREMARQRLEESCPLCAGTVGPYEASADGCGSCRDLKLKIMGTARVAAYTSAAGTLIRQFKFKERHDIEPLLVDWLADSVCAAAWRQRIEAVTFVPTHWRRALLGRFHAASSLAKAVARKLNLPCVSVLRRTRSGRRQVGLTYQQRLVNVRGAFSLLRGASVAGARLLIVDDVRTTGATLEECAKALKRGRCAEIYAAVVARAKGADDDMGNA